MPIPSGSVKHVISGVLPGGEVFQTAWWEKWDGSTPIDNGYASGVATSSPFTTWLTAMKILWNASTTVTALDAYLYLGGGAAASHGHATLSIVGTGTTVHPNQVSVVMTLRTATSGRSGRGRMYWPANGCVYSAASGWLGSSQVDSCVDATATFFSVRNTIIAGTVIIVSQTTTAQHSVTSVDADYVADVQRRRARKQSSTRHSHSV